MTNEENKRGKQIYYQKHPTLKYVCGECYICSECGYIVGGEDKMFKVRQGHYTECPNCEVEMEDVG